MIFSEVMKSLDWSVPLEMLISVIPALICITLHELSHGYVAYKLGDNTAKNAGRLTLNPVKHIDILGLLMMVVFKFGWAKPVPVNMRNFRNPKRGMAICALAGPVSNVVICFVFLFVFGFFYEPWYQNGTAFSGTAMQMIYTTAYLSLALAVFNIIPVPPLDGSKVLFSVMSDESYYKLMRYEKYGMLILLALVASDILGNPLQIATEFLFDKLFVFAEWGFNLASAIG